MKPHTFAVAPAESGRTLAAVIRARLGLSWSQARRLIEQRRVRLAGATVAEVARRVAAGQRIEITPEAGKGAKTQRRPRPPVEGGDFIPISPSPFPISVVHCDEQLVVVNKPAGLTTVRHADELAEFGPRARQFLPPTLADLLPRWLPATRGAGRPRPRAVHRLDRDTSGLLVFALTPEAEQELGRQFRAHTVGRRYLALVRGRPEPGRIESVLVRDRGDGRRGSGPPGGAGQQAVTHVRIVEELGPFALVECRLETGRTHQVRIHLGERGAPLCGETVYDRPPHGAPVADGSGATRPMLHAAYLGLRHPRGGEWLECEVPPPDDMAALLTRLRPPG